MILLIDRDICFSLKQFFILITCAASLFTNALSWHSNNLANSLSPYLKQHEKNPIWWQTWSPKALQYARKNNKLIFISIGYSSCHWCHIMERESFSQESVASILNKSYVAIKIDREVRPDLDLYLQNASEKLGITPGWPLNIWLTSKAIPFHAATYLEKENLITALKNIAHSWANNPDNIFEITSQLKKKDPLKSKLIKNTKLLNKQFVEAIFKKNEHSQKRLLVTAQFPRPQELTALLNLSRQKEHRSNKLLDFIKNQLLDYTLNGLYDPVDSGFFRYTTDPDWKIPHFEKMLYTNAQLSILLSRYSLTTGDQKFQELNSNVLKFLKKHMQNQDGGFYASINAESKSKTSKLVAGYYYGYDKSEIKKISKYQNLNKKINTYKPPNSNLYYLHLKKLNDLKVVNSDSLLKTLRSKRQMPSRDKKVITAWNALAISAMIQYYTTHRDKQFLKSAQYAAKYIKKFNYKNGELYRYSVNKKAEQKALLEDYAFLISSLIDLYQSDYDELWLEWSQQLIDKSQSIFWQADKNTYSFTDLSVANKNLMPDLIIDTHLAPATVIMYENYVKLSGFTLSQKYIQRAKILRNLIQQFHSHPIYYPSSINSLNLYSKPLIEVAIIQKDQKPLNNELTMHVNKNFHQPIIIASKFFKKETKVPLLKKKKLLQGKNSYYICLKGKCLLPTTSVSKAIDLIKKASNTNPDNTNSIK